jgi:hypothetical protein
MFIVLATLPAAARAQDKPAEGLAIDKEAKKVTIPALIAPRKLPNLTEVYPIEIIAGFPAPKGQKAHETVVTIDVKPSDVHKALEDIGLKAGKPAKGEDAAAEGPEVTISLEIPATGTLKRVIPIERALVDKKTGKQMPKLKWKFTGSALKQIDPDKPETTYGADASGTLIAIFPVTDETVFQTHLTMKDEPLIKLDTNTTVLPKEGTPVKLIIQAAP